MKIALITGGSRGLGKSMALHIGKRGDGVILTYLKNKSEAESTVQEIEKAGGTAVALQLDASDVRQFGDFAGQVRTTLKQKWGTDKFDHLINNAGTGLRAGFAETTEEQFDQLTNVHFKGVFFLTQKLLPLIHDGGRILNVSSGLTRMTLPLYSAYASMKGAIEVLTRYMAKELGPRKISVNVVAPGAIATDFNGGVVRDNAALNQQVASITALGRVGQPDDIGGMVASLLADENHWVNAQRIEVSGGQGL